MREEDLRGDGFRVAGVLFIGIAALIVKITRFQDLERERERMNR